MCAASAVLDPAPCRLPLNTSSQTQFQLKDLLTELQTRLDGSYTEAIRQNEELTLVSVAHPLARAPIFLFFFKPIPHCTPQDVVFFGEGGGAFLTSGSSSITSVNTHTLILNSKSVFFDC